MFHEHQDCEGFFQRGEGDRKIQEKKSESLHFGVQTVPCVRSRKRN